VKITLRKPKIDGKTQSEQIVQIKSFLVQLVNDLQIVIDNLPEDNSNKGGEQR
jgi:hypothetical protein